MKDRYVLVNQFEKYDREEKRYFIDVTKNIKCRFIPITFNSKLRCEGVSSTVASSILGHAEKVNNENYTYDVAGNEYKNSVVSNINKELMRAIK